MVALKIANWNIEWMNRWFTSDRDGPPELKSMLEAGFDVSELAERVARAIAAMNADIVTLQEGPSRRSEMAIFVTGFLGDDYSILGPAG